MGGGGQWGGVEGIREGRQAGERDRGSYDCMYVYVFEGNVLLTSHKRATRSAGFCRELFSSRNDISYICMYSTR